jgi:hypothetical protein
MSAVEALQAALAGEHAAAYAYGVIGARLQGARRGQAEASRASHRARRDELIELVAGLGGNPVVAEPAYALPFPVDDPRAARALAADVEDRVAATYADVVTESSGDVRSFAAAAMQAAAVDAFAWRGRSSGPFPGLPERA